MFNVKKFKELIQMREADEYDIAADSIQNELIQCVCESIEDSIQYILNDCTASEFSWLSEIFVEIIIKTLSQNFINSLRITAEKFPEETKEYNILYFIDLAQKKLDQLLKLNK
jgi:hypothetical protein